MVLPLEVWDADVRFCVFHFELRGVIFSGLCEDAVWVVFWGCGVLILIWWWGVLRFR